MPADFYTAGSNKPNRRDKVYAKLRELTYAIPDEGMAGGQLGFDATTIGGQIGVARNNVSMELNALIHDGKAVKILGKPVRYLDKSWLEAKGKMASCPPVFNGAEELNLNLVRQEPVKQTGRPEQSDHGEKGRMPYGTERSVDKPQTIFDSIVGVQDDLKTQVKQAQAAILYPPRGLHTLLIGPTGSGKTTFAEVMYRYALERGTLKSHAPYVIFNCADYAENTQLLISHLFGHVRGAFTGAETERKGLVDQANGGIFFLDEVHRLPPEGQEMLFSIMDRGSYRRLGESENTRKANVLIIAATTEDPKSAILGTFLRRIPLIITLPSLDERSLKGRMTLICQFFREEAVKIKMPVKVSKEVLKVLLLYQCPGNIGQLRNDVQLMCANAFVECVTGQQEYVHVKLSQLSQRLKEGFFTIDDKRQELAKNFNLNDFESITFDGLSTDVNDSLKNVLLYDDYKTQEDFYEVLLANAQKLYDEGLTVHQIKENITRQIQNQFETLPRVGDKMLTVDKEVLSKIVTPEIVRIVEEALVEADGLFEVPLDPKFIYSLALHMETLIERIRLGDMTIYPNIARVAQEHPQEYAVAGKIKDKLEEKLEVTIPDDEVAFVAILLYSVRVHTEGNIQVLVITHGQHTATNMVEVVKTLLGYDCVHALDMPLEEKVEVTLHKAADMVRQINRGSGVLLLVDMGSLTTFGEIITERTGIPTRTIRMVSTPMVIEAARKAMLGNMNLDTLVETVKSMSPLIGGRIKVQNPPIDMDYARFSYQERAIEMLEKILTFLNVRKSFQVLNEVLGNIVKAFGVVIDDSLSIKFLFHCTSMLERVIRNEPLPYTNFVHVKKERPELFQCIRDNFILAEEVFGVSIPDTELAYIVEMMEVYVHTPVPK